MVIYYELVSSKATQKIKFVQTSCSAYQDNGNNNDDNEDTMMRQCLKSNCPTYSLSPLVFSFTFRIL